MSLSAPLLRSTARFCFQMLDSVQVLLHLAQLARGIAFECSTARCMTTAWTLQCTAIQQVWVASSDTIPSWAAQSMFLFAGHTQIFPPVWPGPADYLPGLASHVCALSHISKERFPAAHVVSAQCSRASAACHCGVHQNQDPSASEEAEHTCIQSTNNDDCWSCRCCPV